MGMIGKQHGTSDKQGLVEKEALFLYQTPLVASPWTECLEQARKWSSREAGKTCSSLSNEVPWGLLG